MPCCLRAISRRQGGGVLDSSDGVPLIRHEASAEPREAYPFVFSVLGVSINSVVVVESVYQEIYFRHKNKTRSHMENGASVTISC